VTGRHLAAGRRGTIRIPDSAAAMTWRIGDFGFRHGLSRKIPELIGQHLRGYVESWLDRHGLRLSDVGSSGVHPGGPRCSMRWRWRSRSQAGPQAFARDSL